jgi:hydrogenase maturation protease
MLAIAVVGIGNNLLQDDGVGIHALQYFEQRHGDAGVYCLDAGTVGLALMDRLSNLHGLVAVDAMRLGKPPGTVTVLEGEEMDRHLRNHHGSVHELGLADILDALRLCDDLPNQRALVGIEPERMDWGTEPTPKVAAAIPAATARIRGLVDRWRNCSALETNP